MSIINIQVPQNKLGVITQFLENSGIDYALPNPPKDTKKVIKKNVSPHKKQLIQSFKEIELHQQGKINLPSLTEALNEIE